jgi:hypothetical protein
MTVKFYANFACIASVWIFMLHIDYRRGLDWRLDLLTTKHMTRDCAYI